MWTLAGIASLTLLLLRRIRRSNRSAPDSRMVVAALLVAALTASLAQTIVISPLPAFGRELGVSTSTATWVLTAFMLASAVATPIAGRLGDLIGYRPVLVACLGCFTVGTLVAALGTERESLATLLVGRALQGVSGGVFPLAFGIARATLSASRLGGVIALLSAMFGLGGAAGMVVAGPLSDVAGTASLFWATLVLAVVALGMTSLLPAAGERGTGSVDLIGSVLLSGALVCLLLAISQGGSWGWATLALSAASLLLLAGFVAVQATVAHPLIDLRLLRRRAVATTNLATLVVGAAMFGVITLIPRFVQTPPAVGYGFGASTTKVSLVLVPVAALMLVASPAAGRLAARLGPRVPLQAGALSAAAAFGILALAHDHLWQFYVTGMLIGAGYGLAFAGLGILVVNAVEPDRTGIATAINTIVRTVGGALGAQAAATIVAAHASGPASPPTESGYVAALLVFGLAAVVALAITATIPRRPTSPRPSIDHEVRVGGVGRER